MKNIFVFLSLILFSSFICAQSNVNPDISAIGTFNTSTNLTKGAENYGKIIFADPALELFIEGYLNPYSKAVADVAYEDGKFSVEELYANVVRGLPLDVQIKAGKYLVGFGKLNTTHPHAWAFIDRPLFHQIYFGPEGFNDIGLDVNFILPTENFFSSLDIGIYKGDAIGKTEAADPESEESISELRGNSPVLVGRLSGFFDLDDYNNIEIGLSGAYGIHAKSRYYILHSSSPEEADRYKDRALKFGYAGFDFKYKYKPDSYSALVIQGEGMLNSRELLTTVIGGDIFHPEVHPINTFGLFFYLDYLFDKQFSIGTKYDFTYGIIGDTPGETTLANDKNNRTHGIAGWFGFYPVEETLALRLGVQHLIFDYAAGKQGSDTKATLQLIFSLGPHKAHPF